MCHAESQFGKEVLKMFDRKLADAAQKEYCEKHDKPYVVPINGTCYHCHKNVYDEYGRKGDETGFTVEKAKKYYLHICPHCGEYFDF